MLQKIKLSPFIKDLLDTFLTSVATIVALVVAIRVLAEGLGPEGFGAYSIARRILSTIDPISTFTMGLALTRALAMTKEARARSGYLLAGLILAVVPSVLILGAGLMFKQQLTLLIFRDRSYTSVFIVTLIFLVGYSLFIILYSLYRGTHQMRKANLWQLSIIAIGPMLIALLYAHSGRVEFIILATGTLCFLSLIPLTRHTVQALAKRIPFSELKSRMQELFRYSLPRVPGGLAFPGILAIGPFLAPYFGSLEYAGYLVAGQSILRVVEGGTEAFGRAALPKFAQLFSNNTSTFLRDRTIDIIALVVHLGIFTTLQLLVWSETIVFALLGPRYYDAVPLIRILLFALVPYLAYSLLRHLIDAIDEKAVNAKNAYLSLLITIALSLLLPMSGLHIAGLAWGMTLGFLALGTLTIRYLWKRYRFSFRTLISGKILFANALLLLVAYGVGRLAIPLSSRILQIIIAVVCETVLFVGYIAMLWIWKVNWLEEIKKRVFRERSTVSSHV